MNDNHNLKRVCIIKLQKNKKKERQKIRKKKKRTREGCLEIKEEDLEEVEVEEVEVEEEEEEVDEEEVEEEEQQQEKKDTTSLPVQQKQKPQKKKTPKKKKNSAADSEAPTDDEILDQYNTTSCGFKRGCKNSTQILGRVCPHCRLKFCFNHAQPEVHGCGEAATKHARTEWLKNSPLKAAATKPAPFAVSASTPQKKQVLQRARWCFLPKP